VAESLIHGERVVAESFDCVTIMFTDLVQFTEICSTSTPLEVVEMLNDLYSLMDSIISSFDCYKVETIGDAYMVVSGLPIRNSDHASQIASLALAVLNQVSKLKIRHRNDELFQIRIGIHSGPVVAGCVGMKMPRYCLFGDSVNCASRMESTSESRRIHISAATYSLLKKTGRYACEERGLTFIKGKGEMRTFWLKSEDESSKKHENVKKICLDEWGKTPDLLQLNSETNTLFDKSLSTKSLNNINTFLFGTLTDPSFHEFQESIPIHKNYPSHDCYLCQKKKYLFQKYTRELHHRCERLPRQPNYAISLDGSGSHNECSCNKKVPNDAVPSRSPISSSQTTIKE
jgi:class 3 adenylate cyclase